MKIIDTLSLSTRMFKTRPLRTSLTILGVGVGIGAVLFLVSLGYGLQNMILSQITTADSLLSLDVRPGSSEAVSITTDDVKDIKNMSTVDEVSRAVNISSQISLGSLTSDSQVKAIDPSFFRLNGVVPKHGEKFTGSNEYKAVISTAAVKLFNMTPEQILGKKVSPTLYMTETTEEGFQETRVEKRDAKYEIIGVVESPNDSYMYIPRGTLSDLNINEFDMLKVKVTKDEVMEEVRQTIIGKGYLVSSLSETIERTEKIFNIIQIVLALFGLIALIVSAIGMFNTMTVSLLERINEIGIMRAIGITTRDIMKMFLLESVLMGFLGGLAGLAIGIAGAELANFGLNMLAKRFGGQAMDIFHQPAWFIIFIIAFSSIVGFITGIYPSVKAARINPLNALRYK